MNRIGLCNNCLLSMESTVDHHRFSRCSNVCPQKLPISTWRLCNSTSGSKTSTCEHINCCWDFSSIKPQKRHSSILS
ncbi:hypothetical protein I7I53_10696 [Histoplasma capsulatum var. duboisii H88]|uniref:Uncharacterized protein n=1 Tax=Ajellomyces capsulatus (strain H88) TaxID=544711 RepID=A0A8A1LDN9_AJEC8|nr:hypothetical protein I7I53_10696 [Histoplasma capsulatum var. duboisii H88]